MRENFSPPIKLGSCCTALLLSSNHNGSHQAAKGQNWSSFGRELCELCAYLHSPSRPYLSSVILVVCHFMDPRCHTNSKYLFKPKGALQESTDLWPQTPSVLAVVSLIPAPINGSTNWWDLSNQVVVHMQGIFQGILVRLRTGLFKEAHARQTQRSVWMWLAKEGAGYFTLHFTCYKLHTPSCPTSHDVTLCAWWYLLHVTPPILHISERGDRLPHVTLHPTEPTNCPINTSGRQPLLR